MNLDERPRLQRITRIRERMAGAETALGSDLMNGALEGYAVLKVSGKGEGMEALRRLLAQRFSRGPRQNGGDAGEGAATAAA